MTELELKEYSNKLRKDFEAYIKTPRYKIWSLLNNMGTFSGKGVIDQQVNDYISWGMQRNFNWHRRLTEVEMIRDSIRISQR